MTDALLRWASKHTRGHSHIRPASDFTESWSDGLCFCALMYAYFPDKVPIDKLKSETYEDKIKNCELAFNVAEAVGIEKFLDADDTVEVHDKKSIMLYLSEVYNVLNEKSVQFTAPHEWNRLYEKYEMDRKIHEKKQLADMAKQGIAPGLRKNPFKGGYAPDFLKVGFSAPSLDTPQPLSRGASPGSIKGRWETQQTPSKEEEEKPAQPSSVPGKIKWQPAQKEEEKPKSNIPASEPKRAGSVADWKKKKEEDEKEVQDTPTKLVSAKSERPVFKKEEPPKKEEPKKVEPPKKEEPKKVEPPKKEEPKKVEPPKKEEPKKVEPKKVEPKVEPPKPQPKEEPPKSTESVVEVGELTYNVSGKGKDGGVVESMTIFTATIKVNGEVPRFPKKEELIVHCESPNSQPPKLTIMGGSNGAFHIGFTPKVAGQYWFDFVFRGLMATTPFLLPIADKAKNVPEFPYVGKERKAHSGKGAAPASQPEAKPKEEPKSTEPPKPKASAAKTTAQGPGLSNLSDNEEGVFTVTVRDDKDQIFTQPVKLEVDIDVEGLSKVIKPKITDNKDGTYKVMYGPVDSGSYTINVRIDGVDIKSSPWSIDVAEGVAGAELVEITFVFQTFSNKGDKLSVGGYTSLFVLDPPGAFTQLLDQKDGTYSIDYQVMDGKNNADISVNGKQVDGCPIQFVI